MSDPLVDPVVRRAWITLVDTAEHLTTPCRVSDPDLWHGDSHQDRTAAADLCARCPLIAPCRTYAALAGETSGVWGGHDFTPTYPRREKTA